MKKINKILIKRKFDIHTDLSHLGTFSNDKGKYAIEHDLNDHRTFNYFNADNVENMKQAKQNYKRVMEYENQQVCDYGIIAEAEISTSIYNETTFLINTLTSGGLWGVSSDRGESEFKEAEKGQLEELKEVLKSFGFTAKEINKVKVEFKGVE